MFLPSAASSIAARELSSKGRFYRKERRKKKWRETRRSGVVLKDMMGKGTARCFEFKEGEGGAKFQRACTVCLLLPPSSLLLGLSVESDRRRRGGGWAFGEEGQTIPEMSCYSRQSGCFVWLSR